MLTFVVENVTEAKHRVVLNEILSGRFLYKAEGKQIDAETFEIKFSAGEYAVFRDELLERADEEIMEHQDRCYRDVYDALPRTVNVDDSDTVTISLNGN